jgi:arylsulfatase A-like enzyme
VVDAPGVDPATVGGHVGLDSVPPTVCDLLGVDAPDEWAGQSLLPAAHGGSPRSDPVVSVTVRGESVTSQPIPRSLAEGDLLVSAREGDWTYLENTATGDAELYHRPTDPDQQADRAADPDEAARAAIDRLRPVVRDHASRVEAGATQSEDGEGPGDAVETQLEALGYR